MPNKEYAPLLLNISLTIAVFAMYKLLEITPQDLICVTCCSVIITIIQKIRYRNE